MDFTLTLIFNGPSLKYLFLLLLLIWAALGLHCGAEALEHEGSAVVVLKT